VRWMRGSVRVSKVVKTSTRRRVMGKPP
jgi:hypothetical protein